MQEYDNGKMRETLKIAFPAVEQELQRDLWLLMLDRIERTNPRVPWFDWALAAGLLAMAAFFPKIALLFAYHL
jgi:hypothetical protein